MVDCGVYVDGRRLPGASGLVAARAKVRALGHGFVWVELHEPDPHQMHEVGAVFGLHRLAVEHAVRARQRPTAQRYDDTVFLGLKTVTYLPHASTTQTRDIVGTGEIVIVVGPDFVVTVRHGDSSALTAVRRQLDADPGRLRLGPFAIMHAVADHVVDAYRDVSLRLETDVDAIEEQVLSPRGATEIDQTYLLKRELLELRRAVSPLSAALQDIVTDDEDLICQEVLRRLRDVIDHQLLAAERINGYDELLTSLLAAASARVEGQQNLDVRKISAWVAIASVPTMLASIYGMNFAHMPELHWTWGYPALLAVTGTVCVLLHRRFRRNRWL